MNPVNIIPLSQDIGTINFQFKSACLNFQGLFGDWLSVQPLFEHDFHEKFTLSFSVAQKEHQSWVSSLTLWMSIIYFVPTKFVITQSLCDILKQTNPRNLRKFITRIWNHDTMFSMPNMVDFFLNEVISHSWAVLASPFAPRYVHLCAQPWVSCTSLSLNS